MCVLEIVVIRRIVEYNVDVWFVCEVKEISVLLYIDSGCGMCLICKVVSLVFVGVVEIINDVGCCRILRKFGRS